MNLMKLFNFKYLMQNIKKSKMAIILFLSIVPIFTALTIILNSSYYYALEFYELGLANILFMYITPFILSFSLFGYVFKKKDIDFMCSMPISRKSVFVTNTIGGIVLILISQLITFLLSWVLGAVTDTVVFTGMIWDLFLYQSLAYIFVFTVANLAMTVSGNVITQIVVTLLILFLIPATMFYYDLWQGAYYDLVDGNYTVNADYTIRSVRTYTAPSAIFGAVNSYWQYEPSVASTVKMIILSIAYILLGYFMFEKKKMENAGESFEKPNTHFLVKALTLIPFAMILAPCIDDEEWQAALFLIAIVAVYYFIYDLVTNKKHKFWKSVGMLAISLAATTAVYGAVGKIAEDADPQIEMEDIKSITIDQIAYYMYGLNYEITDKETIETLLYEGGQYSSYYLPYDSSMKDDVAITIPSDQAYRNKVRVWLTINMKNGSEKNTRIYISEAFIKEVMANTTYDVKDVGIVQYKEDVILTNEEEKALKEAINNLFFENKWLDLYEILNKNYNDVVRTYRYENHDVKRFTVPIETTSEIFEIITKAENRNTAEFTRKTKNLETYLHIDMYELNKKFDYNGDCPISVKEYVVNHKDDICNKDKDYITLILDGHKFYTNDVDTIINLIKESKEYKTYIEEGYGRYYDKYYYDIVDDMVPIETNEIIYPEATSTSVITVID
ncbi:MAG: hypothetical protein IKJ32_01045 [Clostridia bacterium]|nr:hypothetical protein [Clostridia bacterium]